MKLFKAVTISMSLLLCLCISGCNDNENFTYIDGDSDWEHVELPHSHPDGADGADGDDDEDTDVLEAEEDIIPIGNREISWINVAGGTFQMGCTETDSACLANETPRHEVSVASFEMTETEITQAQYHELTDENPSHFKSYGDNPLETVSYEEALDFCQQIGGRLPNEAEWEYAARAGADTVYQCGDDPECLDEIAWYSRTSDNITHAAAEKQANAFGLYDMSGNAWEWVSDCYHDSYDSAPEDGSDWNDENCIEGMFIVRGGGWNDFNDSLRVSLRLAVSNNVKGNMIGFRCVREAEER